jgi:hypothetical protein
VIVVGAGFVDEIRRIGSRCHVWAVRTPEYEAVWSEQRSASSATRNERGVTVFNGSDGGPEQQLIDIFATVYEHHGEYSHDPPLDEVEVLGAPPRADVLATLTSYGFAHVVVSRNGFVASRCR